MSLGEPIGPLQAFSPLQVTEMLLAIPAVGDLETMLPRQADSS